VGPVFCHGHQASFHRVKFIRSALPKPMFALIAWLAAACALRGSQPVGTRQFFEARTTGGTGTFWSVA